MLILLFIYFVVGGFSVPGVVWVQPLVGTKLNVVDPELLPLKNSKLSTVRKPTIDGKTVRTLRSFQINFFPWKLIMARLALDYSSFFFFFLNWGTVLGCEAYYFFKFIVNTLLGNKMAIGARKIICLFGFYGISTFVGYLMPNPFLYK